MTRRPSIIAGLDLDAVAIPPTTPTHLQEVPATTAPAKTKAPARSASPDVVHTSIYLPKEAHQKLREIAFTTDKKVHDLIMEGVDQVLRRHGHPALASRKKGL